MKQKSLKKTIFTCAMMLALALAATGCAGQAQVVPTPQPTAQYMPQATTTDGVVNNTTGNATNSAATNNSMNNAAQYDWANNAAQIETRINQISEIKDSRVVVSGDTALVGVYFDPSYRGEMTERIREMIAAEIKQADPNITTVAVTAEGDDVEDIFEMSERVRRGGLLTELEEDVREIVREVTTLR